MEKTDFIKDDIEVIGASENNLKHVDVTIPKGKLVMFAGVSGSGKSSLAFDTIAVEACVQICKWNASGKLTRSSASPRT